MLNKSRPGDVLFIPTHIMNTLDADFLFDWSGLKVSCSRYWCGEKFDLLFLFLFG